MGKGTIQSHTGNGLYSVTLNLDRSRVTADIAELEAKITAITTLIDALPVGAEKTAKKLLRTSYQKKKEYLENNTPEDPTVDAWCADLTEGLNGEVGTIEVPGERGTVNIRPGYAGDAGYTAARDGQLQPIIAADPWAAFYNRAMLPGWQKWQPTFRYATITSIALGVCTVALESATSSEQGLDVNQATTLSDVPIEYMDCDERAFSVGDSVLVKFTGQDWTAPKVIGFKDHPKACTGDTWEELWGETLCANHLWSVYPAQSDVEHAWEMCPELPYSYTYDDGIWQSITTTMGLDGGVFTMNVAAHSLATDDGSASSGYARIRFGPGGMTGVVGDDVDQLVLKLTDVEFTPAGGYSNYNAVLVLRVYYMDPDTFPAIDWNAYVEFKLAWDQIDGIHDFPTGAIEIDTPVGTEIVIDIATYFPEGTLYLSGFDFYMWVDVGDEGGGSELSASFSLDYIKTVMSGGE